MKLFKLIALRFTRYRKLIKQYADEDTLFIYQMGKVGSTTLEYSLPNAIHVHAFYSKNHTCPVRLQGLAKFGFRSIVYRFEQELLAFILRCTFKRRKKTKIITLVREPIKRNLSMFFHDIDAYLYAAHTNCLNTRNKPLPTRCQDKNMLLDVFEQEFNHDYPLTWFDHEFLPMTGVDIYTSDFDRDKGIGYARNDHVEVICINIDKLKYCIDQLSEFVGEEVILESVNQAKEKWYGDVYQSFVQSYKLPEEQAQKFNKSKFSRHFFGCCSK